MGDVTELLLASQAGSRDAMDRLVPLVYDELKVLAAAYLRSERPDHSLQTTALVHEAYLKLFNAQRTTWESRAHFFGIAALAMRHDDRRWKTAQKDFHVSVTGADQAQPERRAGARSRVDDHVEGIGPGPAGGR